MRPELHVIKKYFCPHKDFFCSLSLFLVPTNFIKMEILLYY